VRKALRAICTVVRANAGSIVGLFFFGWKRAPILMPIEQDVAEICAAIPAPDLDTMLPKWTRPAAAAPAAPGAQTPPPASPTGARTTPKPAPDPGAAPPISLPPRPSLLDRLRKLRDGG
jgi:hypothetical protein